MIVVLAALLIAGPAYAGWGGGGRRGGGRGGFGPGPAPGVQDNTDERGPWMGRGPGRGGPNAGAGQGLAPGGGPGRGMNRPYALNPGVRSQGRGRGWGRGFNAAGGPGSRLGRGNQAGRGYQGRALCPYCQGTGQRPLMQGRPNRGQWGQGLRGGGAGSGFRRGAALTGRGAQRGPDRGLRGRNFGPWNQGPMTDQRGPGGVNRGQGPRSGGVGRGFAGRDFGPQGQGPMMQRRPIPDDRGQGIRPGRGNRGVFRGDAAAPEGRGRGINRLDRDDRPLPGQRWGRDRDDRPWLRRGPGVPAEHPEEKDSDTKAPAETETDRPVKDPPASDES
jgi:hypothetical protein